MGTDQTKSYAVIDESNSSVNTFTIVDQNGDGFIPTTLAYTLFDIETKEIINGKENVALSPVSAFVSPQGLMTHEIVFGDNILINLTARVETHVARYFWTWSAAARQATRDVRWQVQALDNPET